MLKNQDAQAAPRATPESKTDAPRGVRNDSVREFRLREPVCVAPQTTLDEAIRRMDAAQTDGIFMCREERVAGLLTKYDLLVKSNESKIDRASPVSEWASEDAVVLPLEATLGDVVQTMTERNVQHIAIIDGERFVGSISDLDVITYLAESYPKETMNLPPVPAQVMDTREGG